MNHRPRLPASSRRRLSAPGMLFVLLLLLLSAGLPGSLQGQTSSREALLESAREEFDDERAVQLLLQAVDPGAAPVDSLWAVSIHELAFVLARAGDEGAAGLWLRWAARHAPAWPLDRSWFPPAMGDLWEQARAQVESSRQQQPEGVEASWKWAGAAGRAVPGQLELGAAVPPFATLAVAGPGGSETLSPADLRERAFPPGTYSLAISAEGVESSQVEFEVLPGVVTHLTVALAPTLPALARMEGERRLARIEWGAALKACANGVVIAAGRAVVASLSGLGARTDLRVVLSSGSAFPGLSVVATDELRDLAVLRLPEGETEVPGSGTLPEDGYAWALYRSGCGESRADRIRITAVEEGTGLRDLVPSLPSDAVGAPLVDASGTLLGMVGGAAHALGLRDDDPLVRSALVDQVARSPQVPVVERGGLPWKWIGAGAALAGLGAALAGGGGGGGSGGGGGGGGGPSTGTMVITFPGGGP